MATRGRGFPLTVSQIMMYAWCIDKKSGRNKFGENDPCYTLWLGFKSRHRDSVKLRKPDSLDRDRALFFHCKQSESIFPTPQNCSWLGKLS